nr:hypothetical protein [Chenggangzhangella methanolivorans]
MSAAAPRYRGGDLVASAEALFAAAGLEADKANAVATYLVGPISWATPPTGSRSPAGISTASRTA